MSQQKLAMLARILSALLGQMCSALRRPSRRPDSAAPRRNPRGTRPMALIYSGVHADQIRERLMSYARMSANV